MIARMQPIGFVALSLACASLTGCKPAATRAEPPPPKVIGAAGRSCARSSITTSTTGGWTRSRPSRSARAFRGHIDKIHFTDGDIVKNGTSCCSSSTRGRSRPTSTARRTR